MKTFTVTATDANGGVTTTDRHLRRRWQRHAGRQRRRRPDGRTAARSSRCTGRPSDPDTGQVLSYQWSQVAARPSRSNPRRCRRPVRTEPAFRRPARRPGDLDFRLRVDDGFDTGEDNDDVHVTANNGPVFTNGASQTISNVKTGASVSMNWAATDPEGDTPITYAWEQVDQHGVALAGRRPAHVTLTTPDHAETRFSAPKGPATLHFQRRRRPTRSARRARARDHRRRRREQAAGDHRGREPGAQQPQDQLARNAERHRDRRRQRRAEREPGAHLHVVAGRRERRRTRDDDPDA